MFLKELKDSLRQVCFVMSFFVLIPLLYLLDRSAYNSGFTFMEYISCGMNLFILITAVYIAYNMFRAEERDGALEYLLSLPLSRMSLLRAKALPRIAVSAVLLLAGFLLNRILQTQGSVLSSLFINYRAGVLYLLGLIVLIQFCGFMLGLVGRRSWSVRLLLLGMVICVWKLGTFTLAIEQIMLQTLGVRRYFNIMILHTRNIRILIEVAKGVINFAVFFGLLWYILGPLSRIWDLKPIQVREIWFQKKAILPMLVFILLLINRLFLHHDYLLFY